MKNNYVNAFDKFKVYFKGISYNKEDIGFSLKLVQIMPEFKFVEIKVGLSNIIPKRELYEKLEEWGLELKSTSFYLRVLDYKKMLQKIFHECEVIDCQRIGRGHPDFKLKPKMPGYKDEFYIEIKKNTDGIRSNQMQWFLNNTGKELYFLFIDDRENFT